MSSLRTGLLKGLQRATTQRQSPLDMFRNLQAFNHSTVSFDEHSEKNTSTNLDENLEDSKRGFRTQGADIKRGWDFRGVHKAIICGKVGEAPVQKILRDGHTVTIFTVGTGGMFDQRVVGGSDVPRPVQWHRVAVHNHYLGDYCVRQLVKNANVFVEGDIETRVYNDDITGNVKNVPEICVRRGGKVRLINSGEAVSNLSIDELREGLL
ncbi:hypothetical protein LUZ60_001500 [Juncus effusus]|nr:hypothetical protein LUZ60_001500 [Juncus effusus]